MRKLLRVEDIPEFIEGLKSLMGIKILPPKNHYLYNLFYEYDRWFAVKDIYNDPSNNVIFLGNIAKCILAFEKDWSNEKIKRYLKNRLNNLDHSNVKGVILEFIAAYHYSIKHKSVNWIPNISNSDCDIDVTTLSDDLVKIECTRKREKIVRATNYKILLKDIHYTFKEKTKQIINNFNPNIILVFIPEEVDLRTNKIRNILYRYLRFCSRTNFYENISGFSIVSYRLPKIIHVNNFGDIYNTDSQVLSFYNNWAKNQLPKDFYFAL